MHRFFISPSFIDGERVTLTDDPAYQIARVLRARPGENIIVLDDSGSEYTVVLEYVTSSQVNGRIVEQYCSKGEPDIKVTLFQALLRADRFELVLQKGTELGISVFVPVLCARSMIGVKGYGWMKGRRKRWQRIISEAAEQSHRGNLPVLEEPVNFSDACNAARGLTLIAWEGECDTGLKATLARSLNDCHGALGSISVFTGPEGSFSSQEIVRARASGITPVSLGRRILRAETASVSAIAAIMYEFGEWEVGKKGQH